jgi:predicted dinucleotide-binding enzyme
MEFMKKNLFFRIVALAVIFNFALAGIGPATVLADVFAKNNLRKPDARDGGFAGQIERELINNVQDGGSVFAIVGGTGDMGKSIADRLRNSGAEVYIGSRKPDLAKNIYANKDAVQKANKVFFAVPGKERIKEIESPDGTKGIIVTSPLRDSVIEMAPYLNDDTIVVSVASTFEPVEKKLTYLPPAKSWDEKGNVLERYNSAAEATRDWIRTNSKAKGIEVVSWGIPNLPAEQMSDPNIRLKIQVAVAGDEKACSLSDIERIFEIMNLDVEPVYVGGLEKCCFIEALTPKIIVGRKEYILALQAGLITVKEALAFLEENGVNCDTKEFTAFVRQRLDPYLTEKYGNTDTLKQDLLLIRDIQKSVEERELTFVGLNRLAEILPQTDIKKIVGIRDVLAQYNVEASDTKVLREMPGSTKDVVETIKIVKGPKAGFVIGAEQILNNPGLISFLRLLKSEESENLYVVARPTNQDQVRQLKVMAVGEVADIDLRDLNQIVKDLEENKGIPRKNIVLIGSEEDKIETQDTSGMIIWKLKAPQVQEKGAEYIAPWSLIFAILLARIYDNPEVTKMSTAFSQSYIKSGMISSEDLARLNNMLVKVSDVPLVPVTQDGVRKQIIAFRETVKSI